MDNVSGFSGKLPYWYQLAMMLRADIFNGALAPGSRIEPEVRLAAKHGVSVMPVRQALRSLEVEGLITRQQGRGTFVSQGSHPNAGSTSLESLYSKEFQKRARILEHGRAPVPAPFREPFKDQEELCFLRRVAYRDDAPWSYGTLYYLVEFNALVTAKLLRRYPLYRVLKEHCGVRLQSSRFGVQAAPAAPAVAGHLGIDPFSPVLNLTSVSYDQTGRAVGALQLHFVSAPCVLSFETLHGDG